MAYIKGGARKGRRKVCQFCVDKCESIDYKDVSKLNRYKIGRASCRERV